MIIQGRYGFLSLKPRKSICQGLRNLRHFMDKECECKIKVLHTDNGGEYMSNVFDKYLKI